MTRIFPASVPLLAATLLGCAPAPGIDAGLARHQLVTIVPGNAESLRQIEVLEDERISPAMREAMWGGTKDPAILLAVPGLEVDAATRASLGHEGFRRAVLRLLDGNGAVVATRRLDCELAEVALPPLAQDAGEVWGVGDDCSTGSGEYAGLITRFLVPAVDRIVFEKYRDASGGDLAELTLVTAFRIHWHLLTVGRAEGVHEVSSHPDFGKPAAAAEAVTEYLDYRWTDGTWLRRSRVEHRQWNAGEAFPDAASFPSPDR